MLILVDLSVDPAALALVDPDVFDAFAIAVEGDDDEQAPQRLADALERIGRRHDAGHVFVDVEALKGLAGERGHDATWLAQLDRMRDYARSKGWVDEAGGIRAHVERPSA